MASHVEDAAASVAVEEQQLMEMEGPCRGSPLVTDRLESSQTVAAQLTASSSAHAEDGEVAELSTESVSSPSVPDWLSAACRSQGPLPYSSATLRDRLQGIDNVNDGALPHAVAVRFKQEI